MISGWLHTALITIVTTYTRAGDRVLLLAPLDHAPPTRWPGTSAALSPGRYTGLSEAAWSIARLGREVRTYATVDPESIGPADPPLSAAHIRSDDPSGGESESGLGPIAGPPTGPARTERASIGPPQPRQTDRRSTGPDPHRFGLIITAVYPAGAGRLPLEAWSDQLQAHGILAIVTHGDHADGHLVDPWPAVVSAGRRAGLAYLDHIALLEIPLRHSRLAAPEAAALAGDPSNPTAAAEVGSTFTPQSISKRVHSDLYVFGAVLDTKPDTSRTVTSHVTAAYGRDSSDV